jgi:hypothetical protein
MVNSSWFWCSQKEHSVLPGVRFLDPFPTPWTRMPPLVIGRIVQKDVKRWGTGPGPQWSCAFSYQCVSIQTNWYLTQKKNLCTSSAALACCFVSESTREKDYEERLPASIFKDRPSSPHRVVIQMYLNGHRHHGWFEWQMAGKAIFRTWVKPDQLEINTLVLSKSVLDYNHYRYTVAGGRDAFRNSKIAFVLDSLWRGLG